MRFDWKNLQRINQPPVGLPEHWSGERCLDRPIAVEDSNACPPLRPSCNGGSWVWILLRMFFAGFL
jgi:hypothetical protein